MRNKLDMQLDLLNEQLTHMGELCEVAINRGTEALKKGDLKQISWKEAFNIFADRVKKIQKENGKESFAFLSTGQLCTEEMALIGHIGRTFLGGNGDGNTRLCMATSVVAYKQSFGFDAPPYTLKDLELSDVIIFFGSNPVVSHPILWGRVLKIKLKIKKL